VARKSFGLDNFLSDMDLDTTEYRLGSIEMRAVWREKEKGVSSSSDGVLYSLGLVKFGIVHEKSAASVFEAREEIVFQKSGEGLLVVCAAFEMIRHDASLVNSNDQRHVWATVEGYSLEGTPASGSTAILAGDVQIKAGLINVDKLLHVARAVKNVLCPFSTAFDTLGIVVPLGLCPHQLEGVSSELVDSLVNATLGKRRLDLKMLIQLVGEPLNRTACKFIDVVDEPIEVFLLDSAITATTPRQLGNATGLEEGVDDTSDSRSRDVEVAGHPRHGHAFFNDEVDDPLPGGVVDFVVFPFFDGRHNAGYDKCARNSLGGEVYGEEEEEAEECRPSQDHGFMIRSMQKT
jgi:hypothetical protein